MTAAELIAKGKTAVEAELSNIEGDLDNATKSAKAKAAVLASELKTYLDTHAGEVATAQALIERATAVVAPIVNSVETAVINNMPASTLNVPAGKVAAVTGWLNSLGWKGGLAAGLGVLVVHYLIGKFF